MDDSNDIVKSLTASTSPCPDDVRKLVKKAQAVARMLANSPSLRKRVEDQCIAKGVPFKMMLPAVKTRWNSVYEMIDPLIHVWDPLNIVLATVAPRDQAKYCMGFSRDENMAFKPTDLSHFKQLKQFLQPFYNATKRLSVGSKPTTHIIIPLMVSLCSDLKSISGDYP
ncbi:hypothetical protein BDR26DRAFT_329232 [Obelidium mucronatum]|nr:hypothetical protein BDR26DRAFT_329232 [Obelidium mucronatum]